MSKLAVTGDYIAANTKTVEEWAGEVRSELRKTVHSIIATGKKLNEALDNIPHGSKAAFYELLPFSETTAKYFRAIAADERILNRQHVDELPASWGTLYELALLDDARWGQLEDAGKITPELERKDIADFFKKVRGTQGTGDNEWYTPAKFIEAAHQVLGDIDTDPASSEYANRTVQARTYYTEQDSGLRHDWHGAVWMNPPYAQPFIQQFIEKLVEQFLCGNISAAIALTHNYTDTEWFHIAEQHCTAICFTRGRVKFESPDGAIAAPTQGQAFFYFGKDLKAFTQVFSQFGFVLANVAI
jgi:phage N-6-adenine-methyltransferase